MWNLALRSIKGSKSRCLLGAGGVATAVLVFLLLSSSFSGLVEKSIDLYRGAQVWDILVIDDDMSEEKISDIEKIEGILMQPGIRMDGGVKGGVLPFLGLKENILDLDIDGSFPEGDQIVLPERLKDQWNYSVGDKIQVSFIKEDTIHIETLEVSGVVSDSDAAVINLEKAQELCGCTYNAVFIILGEADFDNVIREIEKIHPDEIVSYETLVRSVQKEYGLTQFSMNLASSLVFLVAGIGMFATMMISVTGRKREIGILKAIGVRSGELFLLFLMESVLVTGIGALIGVGVSACITFSLNMTGRLFILESSMVAKSIVLSFLVTFLFSLYPLWIAKRVSATDCMRLRGDITR